MEIIFKVLWLDEISGEEGRGGEKSPRAARSPLPPPPPRRGCGGAGKGASQTLERNLESKSSVSGEREPSAASCCWEIKSDDHRETTSVLGSLAAVGDTDCENPGPQSTACSGSRRRWWGDFSICGAGGGMEGPDSKRGRGEKTTSQLPVPRPLHKCFTSPPAEAHK